MEDKTQEQSREQTPLQSTSGGQKFNSQWRRVTARFRSEFGESTYQRLLSRSQVKNIQDGTVNILIDNNKTAIAFLQKNYTKALLKFLQSEFTDAEKVNFVASSNVTPSSHFNAAESLRDTAKAKTHTTNLHPHMTFSNFAVGDCNELAFKAAKKITSKQKKCYSPLYIHSQVGLGKTHLLHAICHQNANSSEPQKYLLLSADRFIKAFVNAIKTKENHLFDDMFENIDLLLIDDFHFIAGKKGTEQELCNIIGRLMEKNCKIVIAAKSPLNAIDNLNAGLASRLEGGLTVEISPMDAATRLALLRSKASIHNVQIPNSVLEYIAQNLAGDGRELEGCLNNMLARADLLDRPITRETMQPILETLIGKRKKSHLRIRDIQDYVCQACDISRPNMLSARRHQTITLPRQIAMYIAKQITSRSLPEIGRQFGGRDHTTVIHACRKIEKQIGQDQSLKAKVKDIQDRLNLDFKC